MFGETFAHDVADIERPEESLLYRWVVEGKWKLLLTYDGKVGRHAQQHPHWKSGRSCSISSTDPHEDRNLAAEHPDVVARLAAKLQEWWPVTERQVLTAWSE